MLSNSGRVSEQRLVMGRTVDLQGLGVISCTVSFEGVETEEAFKTVVNIRKIGVKTGPGKDLPKAVKESRSAESISCVIPEIILRKLENYLAQDRTPTYGR